MILILGLAPHVMRISEKFSRPIKTDRNWRKELFTARSFLRRQFPIKPAFSMIRASRETDAYVIRSKIIYPFSQIKWHFKRSGSQHFVQDNIAYEMRETLSKFKSRRFINNTREYSREPRLKYTHAYEVWWDKTPLPWEGKYLYHLRTSQMRINYS